VVLTALQCMLTVAFGLVITGGAPSVWLMAALLFGASTFFNAKQPIAQAMIADIVDPAGSSRAPWCSSCSCASTRSRRCSNAAGA
jgi:Na+/melibiose symporter-like transporter